ncbi:MAG TPA: sigma-70 family RNA polymerase sigma factor [Gaiellaceae bacterium]|nr:sigma-70 family RNA polymerase sigma factor [Gaiellaceae bacterium]
MRRRKTTMELALDTPRLRAVPTGAAAEPPPAEEASDTDLLVRVAQRDREAFEVLYRRYVRSVFGLALQRLRDRDRAEDATQEMFTAVWRSAGSYKPERGPAAPWLYAIARNAVVDRMRSRDATPVEPPDVISLEPGPSEQAESSFVSWRVHRALETLSEREREVIELAYWSGLSQTEVASFLDIPLGTVKTRTRSALAHLADALEGELS